MHRDGIVNTTGETLFMSAALQLLDPVIHEGAPAPDGPFIAAQPVIRLNSTAAVGDEEGFSTSFVNVGSEEIVESVECYSRHLLAWLSALRRLGLDGSRLVLIAEPVRFRGGLHEGTYMIFDYGGVELGEGIYIDTVRGMEGMHVVDFGFGLERLLWAVNGTPTYYDNLGSFAARLRRQHEGIDAARTAMLMAMAGVTPGHRSHGYRMRITVQRLRLVGGAMDIVPLLHHAFDQWSAFIRPARPLGESSAIITSELNRQTNLDLCRRLAIRPPAGDLTAVDPESFCEALLRRGVQFCALLDVTGPSWS